MPLTLLARGYRFVRGDGSLTLAVVILCVFMFALYPMIEVGTIAPWWLDLAFGAFMIVGATLVFEPRPLVRVFLVLLVVTVAARVIEYALPGRTLAALDAVLVIATSIALGALFIVRATRDGRINLHRIVGACGTFLLLGLVFAQAYKLLALFVPHAFAIGGAPAEAGAMDYRYIYFSFITLTSTGYGDITPLHPYARSLAAFEAIAGQLYLAVLIARLVGLEMEWREAQRDAGRTP
ncbi:MAG TPA: potassium channel family protein [Casimicrobiaceae bacterium]|nr:potassium channel family protein [Casimicrobiaceae bacterium]